jgi:hypothetical protein
MQIAAYIFTARIDLLVRGGLVGHHPFLVLRSSLSSGFLPEIILGSNRFYFFLFYEIIMEKWSCFEDEDHGNIGNEMINRGKD